MTNSAFDEQRRKFIRASMVVASGAAIAGSGLLGSAHAQTSARSANAGGLASFAQTSARRKLGQLEVSSIGLGVQNMARTYQTTVPARPEMIDIIRTAYERGVTFFDTAEAYGPHECERILGEAIAPFRDKIVIASKFGWNIDLQTGERRPGLLSRPDHIKLAVEGSLKRLRTDRIDLLYQHRVDPQVPIEDVAGTIKDLIQQGKVLHFGLSEPSARTIRRAHAVQPVSAIQTEYSIMERSVEHNGVLQTCEELGIGFVPWGPLGQGFLPGKLPLDAQANFDGKTDLRKTFPRFSAEVMKANQPILDFLKAFGEKKGATRAQIALAWLAAQKPWIVSIPGTTNLDHSRENLSSINVNLTPEDLREIEAGMAKITVHGGRMDAKQMDQIGKD